MVRLPLRDGQFWLPQKLLEMYAGFVKKQNKTKQKNTRFCPHKKKKKKKKNGWRRSNFLWEIVGFGRHSNGWFGGVVSPYNTTTLQVNKYPYNVNDMICSVWYNLQCICGLHEYQLLTLHPSDWATILQIGLILVFRQNRKNSQIV